MRVSNPTSSDITVVEGCVVVVASFYSSVICPSPLKKMSSMWTMIPLTCLPLRPRVLCIPRFLRCLSEVPRLSIVVMIRLSFVTVHVLRAPLTARNVLPIPRQRRLITQGRRDYGSVREWSDVSAEARRTGAVAHVGRIFVICVESYHGSQAFA